MILHFRLSAAAAFLACAVLPADAADEGAVATKVQACWSIPAGASHLPPVTVEARIGVDGAVERAESVGVGSSSQQQALAASAVRAVIRCAPYEELPKGAVRFRLDPGGAAPAQ